MTHLRFQSREELETYFGSEHLKEYMRSPQAHYPVVLPESEYKCLCGKELSMWQMIAYELI